MNRKLTAILAAVPVAAAGAFVAMAVTGQGAAAKAPPADYIQGTVTSGKSTAEAGVWVIAEAKPAGTKMRKIVVTDGKGRFVLPQLPDAKWSVWVRGYGLADSGKISARPGADLDLHVRKAKSKRAAAQIYPANYWLSLFNPPDPTAAWAISFKGSCMLCHQIGSKPTRSLFSRDAYDSGTKKARTMYQSSVSLGRDKLLDQLADWSRRIAAGEMPPAPPRPKGKERNLVITQWNWGDKFTYAHDEVATDRNNPRRNANGPVWGVDLGNDYLLRTDPVKNTSTRIKIPTVGGFNTAWCDQRSPAALTASEPDGFATLGCPAAAVGGVSGYLGKYHNPANPHNPMMDAKGRVWITTQIRRELPEDMPAFCKADPQICRDVPPPAARLLRPEDEEVPAHRHVLRHAPPAVRQEGPAVGERRLVRLRLVRPCQVRPGPPRDGADRSGLVADDHRHERRRRRRHADHRLQLRDHPERQGRQRLVRLLPAPRARSSATTRPRTSSSAIGRISPRVGAPAALTATPRGSSGSA